jgi:hypothetical protein
MDDLVKIIFFAIIIISFFGSMFKKKPQPKRQNSQDQMDGSAQQTLPPSNYDILQDELGGKLPQTDSEYPPLKTVPSNVDNSWTVSIDKMDEKPETVYEKPTPLENAMKSEFYSEPQKLYVPIAPLSKRAIELKKKIKSKASLRELYLISEILNKPKSLRSNGKEIRS